MAESHEAGAAGVTVRFFAAARAAAGAAEAHLELPAGSDLGDLVVRLGSDAPALATVLRRCSFLIDEVAVRSRDRQIRDGATVDVLPPFAGG